MSELGQKTEVLAAFQLLPLRSSYKRTLLIISVRSEQCHDGHPAPNHRSDIRCDLSRPLAWLTGLSRYPVRTNSCCRKPQSGRTSGSMRTMRSLERSVSRFFHAGWRCRAKVEVD